MDILDETTFNTFHNHEKVRLFTLKNKNGMVVQVTNYGAIIVNINVKDKDGELADVALGYDTAQEYINKNRAYLGALCGRYANRIANGKFALSGKEYSLAVNAGGNHLHGGIIGFDKKVWEVKEFSDRKVILEYISPDGEEDYPGRVSIMVTYSLSDHNELRLDYFATTDQETILNLTNHSYFNLAGEGSGTINNHLLKIEADFYTPITQTGIPTGELLPVKNTPLDFTSLQKIGIRIDADHPQINFVKGYDHNFVLNHQNNSLGLAATVIEPISGRKMEVYTTKPGLQFYSANWLNEEIGKQQNMYKEREAFCLETQYFPDAINHSHFPSPIITHEKPYEHSTVYKFSLIQG